MKKLKLILFILILSFKSNAQNNFKWETSGSIDKNKNEIYPFIKSYIHTTWYTTKDIIQRENKDSGIIVVKSGFKYVIKLFKSTSIVYYNYNLLFSIKGDKIKIRIDNVVCEKIIVNDDIKYVVPLIQPFEGNNFPNVESNITMEKQLYIMKTLKSDLQLVFDNCVKNIIFY